MKPYLLSLAVGLLVGVIYALLQRPLAGAAGHCAGRPAGHPGRRADSAAGEARAEARERRAGVGARPGQAPRVRRAASMQARQSCAAAALKTADPASGAPRHG